MIPNVPAGPTRRDHRPRRHVTRCSSPSTCAAAACSTAPARVSVDVIAPVRSVMSTVFSPVRRAWHGIFDYDDGQGRERPAPSSRSSSRRAPRSRRRPRSASYEALRAFNSLPGAVGHPHGVGRGDRRPAVELPADDRDQPGRRTRASRSAWRSSPRPAWSGGSAGCRPTASVVRLITDPDVHRRREGRRPAPMPATTVPATAPPAAARRARPGRPAPGTRPPRAPRPRPTTTAVPPPATARASHDGRRQHRAGPPRGRRLRAAPAGRPRSTSTPA